MFDNSKSLVYSKLALLISLLLGILFLFFVRWNGNSGENWKIIISSDGKGYYDYYRTFIFEKDPANQQANGYYLLQSGDAVINKYPVGLAVLWSPFITTAYFIDGNHSNPYARIYQITISLAAYFYLVLGLFFTYKFLMNLKFSFSIITTSVLLIFFGTNLSFYSLLGCSMSHVYSFSLISVFLYFTHLFFQNQKIRSILVAAFVFGLLIIIRPTNVFALGLTLLFLPDFTAIKKIIKFIIDLKFKLIAVFFSFFIPLSFQLIAWYLQTGTFFHWSYTGEGFYFNNPAFFNFLFSFRKGLFIYTPMLLLSIPGFYFLIRNRKHQAFFLIFLLLIIIYTLSSWWNWYYGDSFGMRSMIDFYIIFIFLFSYFLRAVSFSFIKKTFLGIALFFTLLNMFQSYQYYYSILSHFDMNYSKYKYIFGKYSTDYSGILGGNSDIEPFHNKPLKCIGNVFSKADSVIESSNQEFLCLNKFALPSHLKLFDKLHLTIELEYFSTDIFPQSNQRIELIGKSDSDEKNTISSFLVNQIPRNIKDNWTKENYQITFIVESKNLKELELIVFNPQKRKFAIKNFSSKLYCINALE